MSEFTGIVIETCEQFATANSATPNTGSKGYCEKIIPPSSRSPPPFTVSKACSIVLEVNINAGSLPYFLSEVFASTVRLKH